MMPEGEWEPEAENWVRWARAPGFDAYWQFNESFFESILPAAGRRTLEIGCGEGRVARDLVARGHSVVAIDTARTLVRYAIEADPAATYAVANGAELPFPDGCFDVVVAYNALQVVGDMAATVREASRVLSRSGCLCACVAHPMTDLGGHFIEGDDTRFTVRPDYFESRRVEEREVLDGHEMTFRGWTYSLEHYSLALEAAALRIEVLREPVPTRTADKYAKWRAIPLFLNFRAVKL